MCSADPFNLQRFLDAQESFYALALAEIRTSRKQSHWMWFIFPQLAGLGFSPMAERYAITNLDEARAYLAHPILGPRLIEVAEAALSVSDRSASEIFGTPDDLKLRSCATLFAKAAPPGSVFERLLEKYYRGARDEKTLQLLEFANES